MKQSFYPTRPFVRSLSTVAMLGGMVVLAVAIESPRAVSVGDAAAPIPVAPTSDGTAPGPTTAPRVFTTPGANGSTPGQSGMPTAPTQPGQTGPGMLPPMAIRPGMTSPGMMPPGPMPTGMQGDPRLAAAFARGVDAQRRGDLKAAEAAYREVLQLQPKASSAHVNMALLLLQQKKYERAASHLRQAMSIAPKETQPRAILAQTYLNLKQPRKAYDQWTYLAGLKIPDNGQAAFTAGAIAFEQMKDPRKAESWLRSALTQSKGGDPRVQMLLARVLTSRKKHAEAAGVLKTAATRFPQITEIQTALADALWQSGQKDEALVTLRNLEKNTPATGDSGAKLSQVRVMLGRALAQQKQYPEAAKVFREALAVLPAKSPVIPKTRALLAQTLASQASDEEKRGQLKNAITTWGDAIQIFPNNASGYLQRGRLMEKTGDERGALNDFNRALKIAPREGNILANAAILEEKAGDANRALAHWKTLIETQPKNTQAYYNLARLGAKQKQFAEQMDYLETRIRQNPDYRDPYDAVLQAGEKTGRKEIARDWVSAMAKRYPKSSGPRNALIAFDRRNPPARPAQNPTPISRPTPSPSPAASPASTPALSIAPTSTPNSQVTASPTTKPSALSVTPRPDAIGNVTSIN